MLRPIFIEEFVAFSPFDRLVLAQLIRRAAHARCRMAEIGSWLGNGSTQVFLQELATYPGSSLLCVDTWKGNPNVRRHQDIASRYDVLNTFRANVDAAKSSVQVQMLVGESVEASAIVADAAFDLVFIDADHSYSSVKADIAAWRSKVRRAGILCGHDCEGRVTPENSDRLAAHRELDAITGEGTVFAAIHPGSIIAVDEAFSGSATLWAEHPLTLDDGTRGYSAIWHIET
jgi:methyltransferase family protein